MNIQENRMSYPKLSHACLFDLNQSQWGLVLTNQRWISANFQPWRLHTLTQVGWHQVFFSWTFAPSLYCAYFKLGTEVMLNGFWTCPNRTECLMSFTATSPFTTSTTISMKTKLWQCNLIAFTCPCQCTDADVHQWACCPYQYLQLCVHQPSDSPSPSSVLLSVGYTTLRPTILSQLVVSMLWPWFSISLWSLNTSPLWPHLSSVFTWCTNIGCCCPASPFNHIEAQFPEISQHLSPHCATSISMYFSILILMFFPMI